jgi:phage FluMu protein Com
MKIKCKKTKRFLIDIQIEEYLQALEDMGVSQEIPLKIVLPCPRCHKIEEYEIYKSHYVFVGNVER